MALGDKGATLDGLKASHDNLDGKITDLKSDLIYQSSWAKSVVSVLSQSGISKNLLNPYVIENGYALNSSTGETYGSLAQAVTDFIPVKEGKTYSVFWNDNGTIKRPFIGRICGYDINHGFVQYLGNISSSNLTIIIPSGCQYIRLQISTEAYSANDLMFLEVESASYLPSEFYEFGISEFDVEELLQKVDKSEYLVDKQITTGQIEEIEKALDIVLKNVDGELITGKFIEANGTITDLTSYQLLKVAVIPNKEYWITSEAYNGKYRFIWHDSNGNLLGGEKSTSAGTTTETDKKALSPSNAAFVYVTSKIASNVQAVKEFDHYAIPQGEKIWASKKWAVVGDSLTETNVATTKHYFDYISDNTGVTVLNYGVGGTGYIRRYDDSHAFYQRVSSIPTDVDFVTIFGSGNDMGIGSIPIFENKSWSECLGAYTDAEPTTICGAINKTLDNFFDGHPTTPIGIIAPAPWKSYPTTKLTNNWFEDYTNALKQICDYRGVPFLDLYHHSNLRPENEENCDACFYSGASLDGNGDGVHPNELGHEILAPKIYEFVKSLLLA